MYNNPFVLSLSGTYYLWDLEISEDGYRQSLKKYLFAQLAY